MVVVVVVVCARQAIVSQQSDTRNAQQSEMMRHKMCGRVQTVSETHHKKMKSPRAQSNRQLCQTMIVTSGKVLMQNGEREQWCESGFQQ